MTNIIQFRSLNLKDADKLYEIYADKEAMKYRGTKPMQSIEDAKQYVQHQRLREKEVLTIRKGVELVRTKELIGSVMYRFDDNKEETCEIGYSIGRQYWGQGLGKEIVKTLVKTLANKAEIKDIIAWSHKENIASIKILEHNGFTPIKQNEHPDNRLYLKQNNRTIVG